MTVALRTTSNKLLVLAALLVAAYADDFASSSQASYERGDIRDRIGALSTAEQQYYASQGHLPRLSHPLKYATQQLGGSKFGPPPHQQQIVANGDRDRPRKIPNKVATSAGLTSSEEEELLERQREEEEDQKPDRLQLLLQESKFTCDGKKDGYYADDGLDCEVFHYCHDGGKHSWICPESFAFHQIHLICVPRSSGSDICKQSSDYHFVNEYLYRPVNEKEAQAYNETLRYADRFFPDQGDQRLHIPLQPWSEDNGSYQDDSSRERNTAQPQPQHYPRPRPVQHPQIDSQQYYRPQQYRPHQYRPQPQPHPQYQVRQVASPSSYQMMHKEAPKKFSAQQSQPFRPSYPEQQTPPPRAHYPAKKYSPYQQPYSPKMYSLSPKEYVQKKPTPRISHAHGQQQIPTYSKLIAVSPKMRPKSNKVFFNAESINIPLAHRRNLGGRYQS